MNPKNTREEEQILEAYPRELQELIDQGKDQTRTSNRGGANRGGAATARAVVQTNKLWTKSVLKISFKGGTSALHAMIAVTANQWTKHGNIKFDFGPNAVNGIFRTATSGDRSDIRIGFHKKGYYSLLGEDSIHTKYGYPNDISMNFQDFDKKHREGRMPSDWRWVVIHEFGHALGFHHEQQSPDAKCDYDWNYITDYYMRTQGWDEDKTKKQIGNLKNTDQLEFTAHDRNSVMHYAMNANFFLNKQHSPCYTSKNENLSYLDKQMMARAYPFDQVKSSRQNLARRNNIVRAMAAPMDSSDADHMHKQLLNLDKSIT